ncbi:3-hydroxybutyryl-CoA dehydrogenase [Papillibacter cinnamivorans]|uniref:3-hydroxybutyryl-CoA dehydrogenase n=1 Tax=Papillibacter cinnamivorans DSM 12816 TaxID=1122930 RepID=A0A1W1ZJZ2_9FIRM|nr:3-hydroxybutyryl-CoA dehydrogenase [Papillibacter cinnamivorans]SMC48860.1 3-hydroxybutyryl-CoA dehydrogenase [Papillibacter cinnamivorans DSM 12816]
MNQIFTVGAGTMGLGIAQTFAAKGKEVVIRDITDEIIDRARIKLQNDLSKLAEKKKISETEKADVLGRVRFTTDLSEAANAELVIEAVLENSEIKKKLFQDLDGICEPAAIFASNTSSISITEVASATKRPDQFIGMHFFNPAPVMRLVEVIRGARTSDKTFHAVYDLAAEIGKDPIEVQEAPAFVVNKVLIPMINEAVGLLSEGIASAADIDKAMMLGANHPMGPLALGDFIGLDICISILDTIHRETGDPKYAAHPLLRKMVRGGLLGKKSGRGFYDYSEQSRKQAF